jgi:hypothetical protein
VLRPTEEPGGDPDGALRSDLIRALHTGGDSAAAIGHTYARDDSTTRAATTTLSRLGGWLSIAGRHSEATALLSAALQLNGGDPILHWYSGMAACRRNEPASARMHFGRFLELDNASHGRLTPHRRSRECPHTDLRW